MATSSTTSTATTSAFFVYRPRCQPWQAPCARIYFLPCSSAGATKASKNGLKCCSSSLVALKSRGKRHIGVALQESVGPSLAVL